MGALVIFATAGAVRGGRSVAAADMDCSRDSTTEALGQFASAVGESASASAGFARSVAGGFAGDTEEGASGDAAACSTVGRTGGAGTA